MIKRKYTIISLITVILSLSSLFYLPIMIGVGDIPILEIDENDNSLLEQQGLGNIIDNSISALADTTVNTTGNYKTVAYFTQDQFVKLDANGRVFEWELYEDVEDDAADFVAKDFWQDNASSDPDTYWQCFDTYTQLITKNPTNSSNVMNSTIFTPEYTTDTYIQGNVYFMCAGETYKSLNSEWSLRITLERYNPITGQTVLLTQTANKFDDTDRNPANLPYFENQLNPPDGIWAGWVYEATLPNVTLIPAGYRLRTTYEAKIDSTTYIGTNERFELRSGMSGYLTDWTIDSSNDVYDNYYHIQNSLESIGIQLYYYQENYPTIELTGLTNNTVYNTPTNGTITVSSDAETSQYKWDTDSFTSFDTQTIVSLPQTNGWHTLTVQVNDSFNNIAVATYHLGYDISETNIILHSPLNNSLIADGSLLNFTIYDSTSVTFEWDKNGTQFPLTDPFDIVASEGFVGSHQLTIHYTDPFGTELFEYFFIFDNAPPDIVLFNLVNGTTQPQGKNIDISIDDQSYPIDVQYKWDSDSFATWDPLVGTLYRAYLPVTAGWHYLTVFANDSYGNHITKVYSFSTSLTLLNVELFNLVNGSFYQGGNVVEVAITNDNGTIIYNWNQWGTTTWKTGSVIDDIMTLSGVDALNTSAGTYILTVIVGDSFNAEVEFRFIFTVDKQDPTIVQTIPIPDYNGKRFLDSAVLSYTITDNWTLTENLEIFYSFDGESNSTLLAPYQIYLYGLADGNHNLTIIAIDIAGNYYRYYITFIIDITRPDSDVSIVGLANVDGFLYIPASTQVNVVLTDADPIVNSYYSWDFGTYIAFSDSFVLPAAEQYARLDILANDSLGNYRLRTYWITIDDTAPTITLDFLVNNTKINDQAPINFDIEDLKDETVDYIEYQWFLDDDPSIPTSNDFSVSLRAEHVTNESIIEAIISLYTRDVVGNEYNCSYIFGLDFEAPTVNLISTTNNSYLKGGEMVEFSVPSSDIDTFSYKWDVDENFQIAESPYEIMAPLIDGNHTLEIHLADNTSMGIYPNTAEFLYSFIIDDIELKYVTPNDFETNYYVTMDYGEDFNFSVNVRDRVNQTEIIGLNIDVIKENTLIDLTVDYSQFNATLYNFTISASNITDSAFTYIDFEFYQFTTNKQIVRVYIKVNRQQGNLAILDAPESVVYEQEITLSIQLLDNTNTSGQALEYLELNGLTTNFNYELIDAVNYIYNVTFSSDLFFTAKGDNYITLYSLSNFYFGFRNDSTTLSINILPIPISLTVSVNNLKIIYDTDLVVYASLTRDDGTPVQFALLTFCFYIFYKDGFTGATSTGANILAFEGAVNLNFTTSTDNNGNATMTFTMTEDMEYIIVQVIYNGGDYYDPIDAEFNENILGISAGLSMKMILIIAASALVFVIAMSFVIYRLARAKPFEELLEKVSDEDIAEKTDIISPGVILSIFDQSKGPIPLVCKHSLESENFSSRMRIGVDNFLLKISDQAYSSLGFEEHDDRRRLGSINLPNEDMIAFIHGIQLANKTMRGGFENLSLIVLADASVGGFLLANQEFLFAEVDELIEALVQKRSLTEIEVLIDAIRRKSVIIMLAAQKNAKKDKENVEQYK